MSRGSDIIKVLAVYGFFGFPVPLIHNGSEIADAKASFNSGRLS
jgi:hypothetical protein